MSTHNEGSLFDDSAYSNADTSLISEVEDKPARDTSTRWHGGLDLALLLLRLVLGVTMGAHGLQKLFGSFGGPGIDGFGGVLRGRGFTSQIELLSWVTALSEVLGGLLLVLGLFTWVGASALLGVTASIVYVKFTGGFFYANDKGFEFELLLATVALALLFAGPGRISLDVNTPWRRKPVPFAVFGLLAAAAGAVLVLVLFR